MRDSDEELAAAARDGSAEAFSELVRRFERPILSLLMRLVRHPELAQDLAQESFVKAWRGLPSYDPGRPFRSWLFRIAHNTAIDQLRKRRVDTVALEEPESEGLDALGRISDPSLPDPLLQLHHDRALAALETALGELRPDWREVILLRFREGLSYEEIAEVTGQPLGTVKTHLHRARRALMEALESRGLGPGR